MVSANTNINTDIVYTEECDYENDDFFGNYEEEYSSEYDNEQLILEAARELMGISNEDMKNLDIVKIKIRDFKINNILK